MALAALVWWRRLIWLFLVGVTPVILLAALGTTLEVIGKPTCPLSDNGLPLCYVSLAIGCSILVTYLLVVLIEKES